MQKILMLASGGLDSAVAAVLLRSQGNEVDLFYVAYGAQAEDAEITALLDFGAFENMSVFIHRIGDNPWLGHAMTARAVPGNALQGEAANIPGRNIVFLSIASAVASMRKYDAVALGIMKGAYGDNKKEFAFNFQNLWNMSMEYNDTPSPTYPPLLVLCPISHCTKREVIELGESLNVPFHLTWSCYRSGPAPCGQCANCVSRANAFAGVGV
jgi:7-cyano-7-deazaguanine synthase